MSVKRDEGGLMKYRREMAPREVLSPQQKTKDFNKIFICGLKDAMTH